jgi:hypothetical protein
LSGRLNDWQEKPKYSVKTCPSAALSTTNLIWPELGSNLRWIWKPATNRLNYGTAPGHRLPWVRFFTVFLRTFK